jgi:hypothetical protein
MEYFELQIDNRITIDIENHLHFLNIVFKEIKKPMAVFDECQLGKRHFMQALMLCAEEEKFC